MQKAKSPLHKLFEKQQPKVKFSRRKAAVLKTYSDDNYKTIARLIQKWLEEEPKK